MVSSSLSTFLSGAVLFRVIKSAQNVSQFSSLCNTFHEFLKTQSMRHNCTTSELILFIILRVAQWCGPCQMMQPILEDIANRLESEAKVAKVDTDKAPKLGHRYQVCFKYFWTHELYQLLRESNAADWDEWWKNELLTTAAISATSAFGRHSRMRHSEERHCKMMWMWSLH